MPIEVEFKGIPRRNSVSTQLTLEERFNLLLFETPEEYAGMIQSVTGKLEKMRQLEVRDVQKEKLYEILLARLFFAEKLHHVTSPAENREKRVSSSDGAPIFNKKNRRG